MLLHNNSFNMYSLNLIGEIQKMNNEKMFEKSLIEAISKLNKKKYGDYVYLENCFVGNNILKYGNYLSSKHGFKIHEIKVYFYIINNFYYVVSFIKNHNKLMPEYKIKNNKITYNKKQLLNIYKNMKK
jgi:hypothetical protein